MKTFILALFLITSMHCFSQEAIVWGGEGACKDGCVQAAYDMAVASGLSAVIVDSQSYKKEYLENARIWIQPGGKSLTAAKDMGESVLQDIREFVALGGGYVGFCAGAYLTTSKIGRTGHKGLGFIPGKTKPFRFSWFKGISVQPLKLYYPSLQGRIGYFYWEGGPYFKIKRRDRKYLKIKARYRRTHQIAAIDTIYGLGRVSVTGLHPEAPQDWYDDGGVRDKDGLDNHVAIKMIKWASKI